MLAAVKHAAIFISATQHISACCMQHSSAAAVQNNQLSPNVAQ